MIFAKNKAEMINAIAELRETDFSKDPALAEIYGRLIKGRRRFENVLDKNIKAVMHPDAIMIIKFAKSHALVRTSSTHSRRNKFRLF